MAATMAVAMAVLLVLQLVQDRAIRQANAIRVDSLTALAFQFEREFLRFRHVLDLAVQAREPPDVEALRLRLDILISRRVLLDENPSSSVLAESPDYVNALPAFDRLIEQADAATAGEQLDRPALTALSNAFDAIGPDIQALSQAANATIAVQVERQQQALLDQNRRITWLTMAQLAMLLIAVATLVARHRKQEKERLALEQLMSQLRDAQALAESANRGKSQFLANMSHELRTPLNGMLGMLSLMQKTALDQQQAEYVRTASRSADHLLVLLNDLLDLSALEAGKTTMHPEPVHLPELIYAIGDLMRPQAAQKDLDFVMSVVGTLPSWVMIDGTRLKQILLNLLSNAIKFSDQGRISMDVQQVADGYVEEGSKLQLRIRITDQGLGMDASTVARLFRRFEQGDPSASRRFGGTGLGLEISRNLARMMDGDITVTSVLGAGSVFTLDVRMPLAPVPTAESAPATHLRRGPEVGGLDILVAEDHPVNRLYMAALLTRLGHQARFAVDGESAVLEARRAAPDLILMDLHMPRLDGLQATQQIRSGQDAAAGVPIVALTADALSESRARAKAAGMDAFLSKPVRMEQVEQLLITMFGARGAAPAELPPAAELTPDKAVEPAQATNPPPDHVPARQTAAPATKPRNKRFRAGDIEHHLDMIQIGEICAAMTVNGYRVLITPFFLDDSRTLSRLCQALTGGASDELEAAAHSVKGAAASLGLKTLATRCQEIEDAGDTLDAPGRGHALKRLREAVQMAHALLLNMGLTQATCPSLGDAERVGSEATPLPDRP